jgi:uncharacterized protein YbaP (TraB family)
MLFNLTIPGSSRQHYIFGTIHLGGPKVNLVAESLKPYINRCNQFYGEMDITQVSNNFADAFHMPEGAVLKDLYSLRKYSKLNKISKKYFQVNLDNMANIKPLFVVSKLAEIVAKHQDSSLDALLFQHALSHNISVAGLESMEQQILIAESVPMDLQAKMLQDALYNVSKFKKNQSQLIDGYFTNEVNKIYKKSKKSLGGIRKLMLYDRNEVMAQHIITLIEDNADQSFFFCFGAAHLGGAKGVIAFLKRKNLKINLNKDLLIPSSLD